MEGGLKHHHLCSSRSFGTSQSAWRKARQATSRELEIETSDRARRPVSESGLRFWVESLYGYEQAWDPIPDLLAETMPEASGARSGKRSAPLPGVPPCAKITHLPPKNGPQVPLNGSHLSWVGGLSELTQVTVLILFQVLDVVDHRDLKRHRGACYAGPACPGRATWTSQVLKTVAIMTT